MGLRLGSGRKGREISRAEIESVYSVSGPESPMSPELEFGLVCMFLSSRAS